MDNRTARIQFLNLDLDQISTPHQVNNDLTVSITVFNPNQTVFRGRNGSVQAVIEAKQGDRLKGTLKGKLTDDQRGNSVDIEGSFYIQLRRF